VIEEEKIQENAHVVGTYLLKKLAKLRDQFECIGDVRGKGLMIGVEMVTDKETRTPLPSNQFLDIWDDCKNMGVLIGRGGLYKNVSITESDSCFWTQPLNQFKQVHTLRVYLTHIIVISNLIYLTVKTCSYM
jgi:alanine-glyoxylate transaminase/(R)-3-amino-2-methylpropionate-pyruvate transaminase